MSQNLQAFLDTIAHSELGEYLLTHSDNGYNVLVGSRIGAINLFPSYADHPRILVDLGHGLKSTAAGRYQILARYFDAYKKQLFLEDFSPASQDAIAVQMIRECGALSVIESGRFDVAVGLCATRWASLPGSQYGQHTNDLAALTTVFQQAGGVVA